MPDRQITLQLREAANAAADDFGETPMVPQNTLTCWADYQPLGGREFPASQKRHAETTGRFKVNYRNDLNAQTLPATHRISYIEDYDANHVRTFDIKAVSIEERRRKFYIEVAEIL